jgi:P-type conjugative transfer protein TrbJ
MPAAMLLAIGARPAHAFVVFDPTNFVQNLISAVQAIEMVSNAVQQLSTLRDQYVTLQRQAQSITSGALTTNLRSMLSSNDLSGLADMMRATKDMRQSVQQVQQSFSGRLDEAQLLNLTWDKYVEFDKRRISNSESSAVARIQMEQFALDRVQKDYDFVRDQAARIPASAGLHESMQQMNLQMNRMLQQNGAFMQMMAVANGSQAAEKDIQAAEKSAREVAAAKVLDDAVRGAEDGGRASFKRWRQK